ncbi:MAG: hypothetical protein AUJ70_02090 [Candidatus Omnitrophica bacterium CG1_02_40_15]|nr:MAG: hypothetical protein AUJ70_02090 [Candidatus Omnitrophica bacterium CG1_02_40_15]
MIKKLAVVVFILGAVVLISAYAFAEDNAANTANPTDTSAPNTEVAPAKDIVSADEETLPAEEGVGEGVVTGDITALDTAAGSITIKGSDGAEKAFSVVDGETILWKGIEDIKLADIKKSDKAEVGYYTDDAGKLIASWVDVIVPEQPAATGGQTAPVSSQPAEPAAPEGQ